MTSILNQANNAKIISLLPLKPQFFALSVISCLSLATPSVAAVANFDDLPEGFSGTSITDGGITFSNLIAGFRIGMPQFVVESTNRLDPFFSPPNYLTFGGGSNNSSTPYFGAFGSLTISTGELAQSASLDIFSSTIFEQSDSNIVLEAFRKGKSVRSTSISLSEFIPFGARDTLLYSNLSLEGVKFDELQLYTPSAFADGVIFIGLDNVIISQDGTKIGSLVATAAPEPLTILGAITASSFGLLFKRKTSKQK